MRRAARRQLCLFVLRTAIAGDDYVLVKFIPRHIEIMHLVQGVAPEPFGLRPVVLTQTETGWVVAD
jgi:hypothetical protein